MQPKTLIPVVQLFLLALLAAPVPGSAAQAQELTWDDLIPQLAPYDDPFAQLTDEQIYDLGTVVRTRELKSRRGPPSADAVERARASEERLRSQGVDIEGLIAKRDEVRAEREHRAKVVDRKLDRQTIRMPGFALPLEFAGKKVSEFLLVPWVGACIHTPPPPPNQIVHVRVPKGAEFESKGMFSPVWVTGVMRVKASKQSLNLVDGVGDIEVGYSLEATAVEDYKEK